MALLAHLEYRDGIKLGIKPWERGTQGGVGWRVQSPPLTPKVLEVVFTYTSNKFRVTTSLVKLVFSIEDIFYRCSYKGNIHKSPRVSIKIM